VAFQSSSPKLDTLEAYDGGDERPRLSSPTVRQEAPTDFRLFDLEISVSSIWRFPSLRLGKNKKTSHQPKLRSATGCITLGSRQ